MGEARSVGICVKFAVAHGKSKASGPHCIERGVRA